MSSVYNLYSWRVYERRVYKNKVSEAKLAHAVLKQFIDDIKLASTVAFRYGDKFGRIRFIPEEIHSITLEKILLAQSIKAEIRIFLKIGNQALEDFAEIASVDYNLYKKVIEAQARKYGLL